MDAFIQIIADDPVTFTNEHVRSLYSLLGNEFLTEDASVSGVTENKQGILHVPLRRHISSEASDLYAHIISEYFNNEGINDFVLEMSTGIPINVLNEGSLPEEPVQEKPETRDIFAKTDYDVVDDLITYMRNNYKFYSSYYYPALHRITKNYKKTKKIDIERFMMPVIRYAIKTYCVAYNTPEEPDELFGKEEIQAIIDRIRKEEQDEIQNGEY